MLFQYVESAGSDGTSSKQEAVTRESTTNASPDVVGPYFMGPVEEPAKEEPTKKPEDVDEGVIDVLNYRGPKK